jgi:hypothetical protein
VNLGFLWDWIKVCHFANLQPVRILGVLTQQAFKQMGEGAFFMIFLKNHVKKDPYRENRGDQESHFIFHLTSIDEYVEIK